MTHVDIDPILKRGIRLLHSKSRDSYEQLKALADEVLHAKQRGGKIDEILSIIPPKRPRINEQPNPSVTQHAPSPTPSIRSDSSSRGGSRRSDESDDQEVDMNDVELEITSGIKCTVCKQFHYQSVNQIVECQECHLLYHQECHKPPISKADITDPRRVWYCSKCTRSMKKQTSGSSISSSQSIGSSTRSSNSTNSSSKSSSLRHSSSPSKSHNSSKHSSSPSKGGVTSGSSSSRPSPFTNLSAVTTRQTVERTTINSREAKLSASSSGSSGGGGNSSSSRSSSSSSNTDSSKGSSVSSNQPATSAPSNTFMTAEKRMQMMKKKAAAKNAERRKI